MTSDFTADQDEKTKFAKDLRTLATSVESGELPAVIVGIMDEDGKVKACAHFDDSKPLCRSCTCNFVNAVAEAILSFISQDAETYTEYCH
jgi:hypothetical protein